MTVIATVFVTVNCNGCCNVAPTVTPTVARRHLWQVRQLLTKEQKGTATLRAQRQSAHEALHTAERRLHNLFAQGEEAREAMRRVQAELAGRLAQVMVCNGM